MKHEKPSCRVGQVADLVKVLVLKSVTRVRSRRPQLVKSEWGLTDYLQISRTHGFRLSTRNVWSSQLSGPGTQPAWPGCPALPQVLSGQGGAREHAF